MIGHSLAFTLLDGSFAVVKLGPMEETPSWAGGGPFVSVTRTDEELSVVCREGRVPGGARSERGLKCLKVEGPFDFAAVGVVASFASALAIAAVSIFVVSTFDTDYLLVKEADLDKAAAVLREAGHRVHLAS